MKTFEIGKMYGDKAVKFEIISRTEKFVTYVEVQHPGRHNERKGEQKRIKIRMWGDAEVIFPHDETVIAQQTR